MATTHVIGNRVGMEDGNYPLLLEEEPPITGDKLEFPEGVMYYSVGPPNAYGDWQAVKAGQAVVLAEMELDFGGLTNYEVYRALIVVVTETPTNKGTLFGALLYHLEEVVSDDGVSPAGDMIVFYPISFFGGPKLVMSRSVG